MGLQEGIYVQAWGCRTANRCIFMWRFGYRCFCADAVLQIDEERVDVMVRCGGLQERMLWVQVWGSKNMDWCGVVT